MDWQPAWISTELAPPAPAWPAPARGSLWQELTKIEPRVTDDRGDVPLIAADKVGQLHVLVGSSATDRLVSLDPQTGELQWQFMADAPLRYAPCVHNGIAYFGADDGSVRAVDLRDGGLIWQKSIGPQLPWIVGNGRLISAHPVRTSVVVAGDLLLVNAGLFPSQGVYTAALRIADGTLAWRRRTLQSPQGYLLLDDEQQLIVPCGRGAPFAMSLEYGRFRKTLPSAGGTFCMLTPTAFFSGPGNDANVQTSVDVPDAKMLPIGGRTVAAGNGLVWIADGRNLQCHHLNKLAFREPKSLVWTTPCKLQAAMIVSGYAKQPALFVAGGNRLQVFDARTGDLKSELATAGEADEIRYLAVSAGPAGTSDVLVATAENGRVYAWTGHKQKTSNTNWPATPATTVKPLSESPRTAAEVESALRQSHVAEALQTLKTDVGLALVLEDSDGKVVDDLTANSRLQVVSVVSGISVRDRLRARFLQAGLYGRRVTILHVADDESLPFSPRIFNLLVEARSSSRTTRELTALVDSRTGVLVRSDQKPVVTEPFAGGGVWRHQYASPTNTADSGDRAVGAARGFRLLWFGGVGPSRMPDRHLRGQAPLAAGSTMVLHGDECLIGVDPANGTERWHVDLPPDSMRYGIPYDAGYSCLTADGSTFYTAAAKELWKLNAYTGDRLAAYPLPASASGMHWGSVAEIHGRLFATGMKPTAGRLKGRPGERVTGGKLQSSVDRARRRGEFSRAELREKYTVEDYSSERPMVCSRFLFCLDDEKTHWTYAAKGVIPHGCISINEAGTRILFIEGNGRKCQEHATDRVTVPDIVKNAEVVCLNAATGQELWRKPFAWAEARNILYTQIVDDRVVLATSETRGKVVWYNIRTIRLSDGSPIWSKQHARLGEGLGHGEQVHHPLALRQESGKVWLIAEPYLYDLETGEQIGPNGAAENWALRRPGHSCGTLSGAGQCVFFRATNPTVLNLAAGEDRDRFQRLSPSRPGCWINMLPVNGRLLIPEGSASCVCAFPLQTSMGFVPVTSPAEVPLLTDFPPLIQERVEEIHAWNFDRRSLSEKAGDGAGSETDGQTVIRPAKGSLAFRPQTPPVWKDDGLVLDGKQWLALAQQPKELPPLPVTMSLEAKVTVGKGTPDWSGLIGALQDNGDFERGISLGIHKQRFYFALASATNPRLTYLSGPQTITFDKPCHVCGTYDGTTMRLYIDGKLVASSTEQQGPVLLHQQSWLSAGIYKDDNEHFPLQGILLRVAIFRGALSPEQVRERAGHSVE